MADYAKETRAGGHRRAAKLAAPGACLQLELELVLFLLLLDEGFLLLCSICSFVSHGGAGLKRLSQTSKLHTPPQEARQGS